MDANSSCQMAAIQRNRHIALNVGKNAMRFCNVRSVPTNWTLHLGDASKSFMKRTVLLFSLIVGCASAPPGYRLCREPSSQWGVSLDLETSCLVYREICDPLPNTDDSEDMNVLVSRLPMLECWP